MTAQSLAADPGSVEEIGRAVESQRADPVVLLEASLRRIDAVENRVHGWRLLDRDSALAQARVLRQEAEAGRIRSPLHGIPVAVKDVLDVAGLPTRAGSPTRADIAPSTIDAQVVAQLRAAGAIILGKAHTTEFAYFDGPPPTRNPHNLAHTPGGSSGGPAAVVAAGMVPLSLGTQTAGSVSRPAAYCGIAAFKPSTRAWSSFGVVPFAPSFDTVGVFGYRVSDALAAARAGRRVLVADRPPEHQDIGAGTARLQNRPATGEDAGHEGVVRAIHFAMHRRCQVRRPGTEDRKIGRGRQPDDDGIAIGVHGNGIAEVFS